MAPTTSDARFFGIDLRALWRDACRGWSDLRGLPPLSWLAPTARVRLFPGAGGPVLWWGDLRPEPANRQDAATPFAALELPEDLVLRRSLRLPPMGEADTASAVALQVRSASPFSEQDLAWGYRTQVQPDGSVLADAALASRKQVAHYIQSRAQQPGVGPSPEVWVLRPAAQPIIIQGYGEARRQVFSGRGWLLRYALLASAMLLLAAIAVSSFLQLRLRALEAYAQHQAAVQRTAPLVSEREALLRTAENFGALVDALAGRIEPLRVLERLTQVLPDDTALQSFSLKGQKVTIAGLTPNAPALMQILGEQAGVRDVRAPSPAMRTGGPDSKENFVIEFTADPHAFGVAVAPPDAAKTESSAKASQ